MTPHEAAVAALTEMLVMADDEGLWTQAVVAAFPACGGQQSLGRKLRWAPVPVKRRMAELLSDLTLSRSESAFLALAGSALPLATQHTHPVWAELAAPGRTDQAWGAGGSEGF